MSLNYTTILEYFDSIDGTAWNSDPIRNRIISILANKKDYLNLTEFLQLQWKMDTKYNCVMSFFVRFGHGNIKTIYEAMRDQEKKNQDSPKPKEKISYKKTQRMVYDLLMRDFIYEYFPTRNKNLEKDYFSYKLTPLGIFYCILNWFYVSDLTFTPYHFLKCLFKTYPNTKLFIFFLFPYFEKETVDILIDRSPTEITQYLQSICKIILQTNHKIAAASGIEKLDDTIKLPLFWWPTLQSAKKSVYDSFFRKGGPFRSYISRELKCSWVNDAEMQPDYENNLVAIENPNTTQHITIRINITDAKAKLTFGQTTIHFRGERLGDSIIIHQNTSITNRDTYEREIRDAAEIKLMELVYQIQKRRKHHRAIDIQLQRDNLYNNTVLKIKDKFNLS